MAQYTHRPGILVNQTHQDADGCRLPGSVRPDKPHDAAVGQFKMDILQRKVRVSLAYAIELDRKIVHTFSFVSRVPFSRFEASLVRRAISSLLRPSNSPSCATFSRCSENSSS